MIINLSRFQFDQPIQITPFIFGKLDLCPFKMFKLVRRNNPDITYVTA